jgi:hypothetical protein
VVDIIIGLAVLGISVVISCDIPYSKIKKIVPKNLSKSKGK